MHEHTLDNWRHEHDYSLRSQHSAERRTRLVIVLTVTMMVAELVTGYWSGSMALTADGWHMGSHAAALSIAAFAYAFARRHAHDTRFSFGTGKVGPLAGFTSAVVLAMIALLMALQSADRLISPVSVHFNEAMWVAAIGLVVNLVSAIILGEHHHHDHEPHEAQAHQWHADDHDHGPHHHHHDHNLRAAYLHVLADALTSVLAIVALLTGKLLGWVWMDPAMGIVGSVLIARWSYGLLRDTGQVLLDAENTAPMEQCVRELVEQDADNRLADLHIWRVGPASHACIASIVTHDPRPVEHYKALLRGVSGLDHVTVEINHCHDSDNAHACPPAVLSAVG